MGMCQIEAHKVILAGSSTFFSRLLKQNKHTHPLFYMRGINASQLSSVVDFIYLGEVNIFQEDLDAFLNLAEELQLKGLNGNNTHQKEPMRKPTIIKPNKVMNKTNNTLKKPSIKVTLRKKSASCTVKLLILAIKKHPWSWQKLI